jgi:serine/threonine-protein kinase
MDDGKLGKYEILGTLGKGAIGTVYDARDPVIDRRVAIKTAVLPDASDAEAQEEIARFRREAQAAGRLTHPNIVGVFDYGETDKLAYIVMEFVDGPSLKELLEKQERFTPADAIRLMEGLLAGLQYSHERGVVHRDIKPANIMLTRDGAVKIADFGIARIESSSMTQVGTILGTPAYMSPEQFMGQTVDARTDIYSAGVVLYQLLTGERPFDGSMTAIMHKVLNTEPPLPSQLSVTAPSALDDVVAKAMSKRPEQRFASAAEFARSLRAASEGGAVTDAGAVTLAGDAEATMVAPRAAAAKPANPAVPPAVVQTTSPVRARSRTSLLAGVAAAAVLVLGAGAYFVVSGNKPANPPEPIAVKTAEAGAPAPAAPSTPVVSPAPVSPPPAPVVPPPADTQPAASASVAQTPATAAPTVEPPKPETVSAPPAPPPPLAPQPEQVAANEAPAALGAAIAEAVAPVACSMVGGDVTAKKGVVLTGIVGHDSEAALHQAVTGAAADAAIDWHVATFTGPYCDVLGTLRPAAQRFGDPAGGFQIALKTGTRALTPNEFIVPRVTMPEFGGYLLVDYVTRADEQAKVAAVSHLYPSRRLAAGSHYDKDNNLLGADGRPVTAPEPLRPPVYAAHEVVAVGDPAACRCASAQVGPPFGTDLVFAVASTIPLFATPREADDEADATSYLQALGAAIERARGQGAQVTVRIIPVRTVSR